MEFHVHGAGPPGTAVRAGHALLGEPSDLATAARPIFARLHGDPRFTRLMDETRPRLPWR